MYLNNNSRKTVILQKMTNLLKISKLTYIELSLETINEEKIEKNFFRRACFLYRVKANVGIYNHFDKSLPMHFYILFKNDKYYLYTRKIGELDSYLLTELINSRFLIKSDFDFVRITEESDLENKWKLRELILNSTKMKENLKNSFVRDLNEDFISLMHESTDLENEEELEFKINSISSVKLNYKYLLRTLSDVSLKFSINASVNYKAFKMDINYLDTGNDIYSTAFKTSQNELIVYYHFKGEKIINEYERISYFPRRTEGNNISKFLKFYEYALPEQGYDIGRNKYSNDMNEIILKIQKNNFIDSLDITKLSNRDIDALIEQCKEEIKYDLNNFNKLRYNAKTYGYENEHELNYIIYKNINNCAKIINNRKDFLKLLFAKKQEFESNLFEEEIKGFNCLEYALPKKVV